MARHHLPGASLKSLSTGVLDNGLQFNNIFLFLLKPPSTNPTRDFYFFLTSFLYSCLICTPCLACAQLERVVCLRFPNQNRQINQTLQFIRSQKLSFNYYHSMFYFSLNILQYDNIHLCRYFYIMISISIIQT